MRSTTPNHCAATRQVAGKRALVIGGSGFIGSWLCRYLTGAGAEVFATVRTLPLPEVAPIQFRQIDIHDTARLENWITKIAPEIVFNAAAYGVDHGERDAEQYRCLNADFPARLCELLDARIKLIHLGSGAEYGTPDGGELSEDTVALPDSIYGTSKLAGTRAVVAAGERGKVDGLVARLFTVYGAGEHGGRLLPSLIGAKRTEAPIPLTSGLQKRDFTYVEDVAEGLMRLAVAPSAPGTIVNLATGKLSSVRTFAQTAADALGLDRDRLQFGALPDRVAEIAHPPVSTARMSELIEWVPPTGLFEGIYKAAGAAEMVHT